ncbi:T9SS type A sorting domain-containing protein [Cryomorpha ignava]|uniref:T9SS type A sorting domain-containing protein n=1 Tax=Cryomorpha ignava TaxID=101383 RepID=A0A7K3WTU7_9FLAO|nr:T9SS type A sorting domain-containing protein [Cryomorpha ignava]NEN24441.1 T9SS type A sorting domain-containing protein [Cryomorpha ignava]
MMRSIGHLVLIIILPTLFYQECHAQSIYSLDEVFNENIGDQLFKGSAVYFFREGDGKIVVTGDFQEYPNNAKGVTRLFNSGTPDPSFSFTINGFSSGAQTVKHNDHYFYANTCIMLDGSNPCDTSFWYNKFYYPPYAGSGTTRKRPLSLADTTLVYPGKNRLDMENPGIFQLLIGLKENGIVDPYFPHFEAEPMPSSLAREIEAIPGGGYYLVGKWTSVNGYESPDIIRLTEQFEIDTTFKSPFVSASISIVSADSLGRAWFSAANVYSEDYQDEDIPLLRLNTDGSIDSTFNMPTIGIYSTEWFNSINSVASVVDDGSGYVIGGSFGSVNGEDRICIAKLSESGELLPDFADIDFMRGYAYVFGGDTDTSFYTPTIRHMDVSDEGNLLVIGAFNDVGNHTCHNIMQFNPSALSAKTKKDPFEKFTVFPNPSSGVVNVFYAAKPGFVPAQLNVYDVSGRKLVQEPLPPGSRNEITLTFQHLKPGMYVIEILTEDKQSGRKKLIIHTY